MQCCVVALPAKVALQHGVAAQRLGRAAGRRGRQAGVADLRGLLRAENLPLAYVESLDPEALAKGWHAWLQPRDPSSSASTGAGEG